MSVESVIPSNHLIPCRPLLLLSVFPSIIVFSSESSLCIRWAKYWSFSSSISLSNEYSELISFRIDWFDFLSIQGTFKSLCQHYSSKVSILPRSAFFQFSSVQFSRSVMSDSLLPHGLQQARPPCPSPTLGAYSNSCPLSQWCHPTTSSSVAPFFRLQSFTASGSFQMSQLFASGGQSIGVSASTSVSPSNEHSGLISFLYGPSFTSIHDYWKNHSFDYMDLCQQSDISAFLYAV